MAGWVVGGAVLPAAPDDAAPGAAEGAERAGVVVAAGAGGGVEVLRPGVPVAGAVGQGAERASAGACCSPSGSWLSCACRTRPRRRLGRRRRRACHGWGSAPRQSPISASSSAAVTTLRGSRNSERKISPSGCSRMAVAICSVELLDLLDEWLDRRDQGEHERPAGGELGLADAALGRAPELGEQLARASGHRSSAGAPGTPEGAARPDRARRRGSGSAPGTPARSGCRAW